MRLVSRWCLVVEHASLIIIIIIIIIIFTRQIAPPLLFRLPLISIKNKKA